MKTIIVNIPTIEQVTFKVTCHEEHIPIKGNYIVSGDDYDREQEQLLLKELEYNEWAWCCIKVTAEYKGLKECDYLGGCSYDSEEDFKNCGYYEDMKATAYSRLIERLEDFAQ
jgi:hypothetical protein